MRITGAFRAGDVRHAVADNALARDLLGWTPKVSFNQGIAALVAWARDNKLARSDGGAH
jgi:dTDP-L-rhamnose 4-epimerase